LSANSAAFERRRDITRSSKEAVGPYE